MKVKDLMTILQYEDPDIDVAFFRNGSRDEPPHIHPIRKAYLTKQVCCNDGAEDIYEVKEQTYIKLE